MIPLPTEPWFSHTETDIGSYVVKIIYHQNTGYASSTTEINTDISGHLPRVGTPLSVTTDAYEPLVLPLECSSV